MAAVDPRIVPPLLWALTGATILAFAALSLYGHLWGRPRLSAAPRRVSIVVVSKAGRGQLRALLENLEHHAAMFRGDARLYLLVDEDSECLVEARRAAEALGYEVVVVPRGFESRSRAKARAIDYFVKTRVEPGEWYAFIDDDNLILDKLFMYEIEDAERRGLLVGNPVLVPRPGRSVLAYVMDHVKLADDLVVFRGALLGLHRPLVGLHGELLLARGDVLLDVGFEFDSITEDYRFAAEAYRRGYRFFQSRTRVSILSPHSVGDLLRQRTRWFRGLVRDIPRAPPPMLLATGFRSTLWPLGIIMAQALLPLYWLLGVSAKAALLSVVGAAYYGGSYLAGVASAARRFGASRALLALAAMPLYSVIESLAPYRALLGLDGEGFVVIEK